MSSLFEWTSGVHTIGEYQFEWLPLLKTPCFGFSGPNACYSSTCNHNPTLKKGSKYTKSKKIIINSKCVPLKTQSQIRATSTPFDSNSEICDRPEYYPCETKLSPLYSVQGIPITNIEQPFQKCSNGLSKHSMDSINKKCLHYVDEHYQNIDKYNKCVRQIEGNQPLYQRGSESPQKKLNPESKPFNPLIPWQWQSYQYTDMENQIECPFECILCSERFRTFKQLQCHYRNKIVKPYNCMICKASFKHKYLLWRHRNIHRTLQVLQCRGCKKSFRSFLLLKKHFEECRYKLHVLTESENNYTITSHHSNVVPFEI